MERFAAVILICLFECQRVRGFCRTVLCRRFGRGVWNWPAPPEVEASVYASSRQQWARYWRAATGQGGNPGAGWCAAPETTLSRLQKARRPGPNLRRSLPQHDSHSPDRTHLPPLRRPRGCGADHCRDVGKGSNVLHTFHVKTLSNVTRDLQPANRRKSSRSRAISRPRTGKIGTDLARPSATRRDIGFRAVVVPR